MNCLKKEKKCASVMWPSEWDRHVHNNSTLCGEQPKSLCSLLLLYSKKVKLMIYETYCKLRKI